MLVHVNLLLVERGERVQQVVDRLVKPDIFVSDEVRDVSDIAADELQLLLMHFRMALADRFLLLDRFRKDFRAIFEYIRGVFQPLAMQVSRTISSSSSRA